MSTYRRVMCGMAGAALLFAVVLVDYLPRTASRPWTWAQPSATIIGYLVSATAFYLLATAASGRHLGSRHRVACLVAALVLASLLVVGMKAFWELAPRHPDDWLDG